jgi:broad specificity phosphatase PhoE
MVSGGRRLVVWRHGRTVWNQEGRFQGRCNMPLSEAGVVEVEAASIALEKLAPTVVLTSDSTRAIQTARPLADRCGLAPVLESRLQEVDLGAWSGLTREQVAERFPGEYAAWRQGADISRGGGENYSQVARRAQAAVTEAIGALEAHQTLVAVTHGATARAIIGWLMGLDTGRWRQLGTLGHARWAMLREMPYGWRLAEFNARARPRGHA